MGKIYIENNGDSPMFVGGRLIPPGGGRLFEASEAPPEYHPAAGAVAEEPAGDPAALLDAHVNEERKHSVHDLKLQLPNWSHEALVRLQALEGADETPRKTLLEAIGDELIRRADDKLQGDSLADGSGNTNTGA